jgi:hypothetical protein
MTTNTLIVDSLFVIRLQQRKQGKSTANGSKALNRYIQHWTWQMIVRRRDFLESLAVTMKPYTLALGIVSVLFASQAGAQITIGRASAPTGQTTTPAPAQLRCFDFQHNPDGSWSPTHPITTTNGGSSVSIGPGISFGTGDTFAGINLTEWLNAHCIPH